VKLAEIAIVMVAGTIEDERLFSALAFVLNKQRSSLRETLEKCVRLMTQQVYTIHIFPWSDARMALWCSSAWAVCKSQLTKHEATSADEKFTISQAYRLSTMDK
jgi:hypothetical protein